MDPTGLSVYVYRKNNIDLYWDTNWFLTRLSDVHAATWVWHTKPWRKLSPCLFWSSSSPTPFYVSYFIMQRGIWTIDPYVQAEYTNVYGRQVVFLPTVCSDLIHDTTQPNGIWTICSLLIVTECRHSVITFISLLLCAMSSICKLAFKVGELKGTLCNDGGFMFCHFSLLVPEAIFWYLTHFAGNNQKKLEPNNCL